MKHMKFIQLNIAEKYGIMLEQHAYVIVTEISIIKRIKCRKIIRGYMNKFSTSCSLDINHLIYLLLH